MRTWKRIAVCVLFFLAARGVATVGAEPQSPDGTQQFADFGDFKLRNGSVIHDFRIGYRTVGQLNTDKSNASLWATWLGGTAQDLGQFIGHGNVLDSTKYCVVLVDATGNGVSSSPS